MSLSQLNLEGLDKEQSAIQRLKEHEPPEGYYLAFSGGKDSVVLYDVVARADVKFDAHYHVEIDPPEQIQFIKSHYSAVHIDIGHFNFWKLIETKGLPLRKSRWCCEYFKEWGGGGRVLVTGVRAAESAGRRKRKLIDTGAKTRFGERPRFVLHPIIDWGNDDVWEYIRKYGLPYCSLYDEGFKRLGCVMCPMSTNQQRQREMYRFPKIADAWRRATNRLFEAKRDKYAGKFNSGEELFNWWMGLDGSVPDELPGSMFEKGD